MTRTEGGDHADVWPVTLADIDRSLRMIASELGRLNDYAEHFYHRSLTEKDHRDAQEAVRRVGEW